MNARSATEYEHQLKNEIFARELAQREVRRAQGQVFVLEKLVTELIARLQSHGVGIAAEELEAWDAVRDERRAGAGRGRAPRGR